MTNTSHQRAVARVTAKANFTTHGRCGHPLYATWKTMHQRCRNPRNSEYARYGARGIRVCERWSGPEGFPNFLADMGERPLGYTLDRRNNDGDYAPDNCRWATGPEQASNRRLPKNAVPQEIVEEIRRAFATGSRTVRSLAREYELPRTTVSSLVHGPGRRGDA